MIATLRYYWRVWSGADERSREAYWSKEQAYWASDEGRAQAERNTREACERCDICSGRKKLRCPICYLPITKHSHEGDFLCDEHSFVKPISEDRLLAQMKVMQELQAKLAEQGPPEAA